MPDRYDVIVLGAGGAMGSSACLHLALRGKRVLGLDQFDAEGHDRGSSHGRTRIIRKCYYEHPDYVPLLDRAYELWRALERWAGVRQGSYLEITGGIYIGPEQSPTIVGSRTAAERHRLSYELLTQADLPSRFPQFMAGENMLGFYEPSAGILRPERIINATAMLARRHGVDLRGGCRVEEWVGGPEGVRVRAGPDEFVADAMVIAAGAWAGKVVRVPGVSLRPTRQVMGWVRPKRRAAMFTRGAMPVWAIDADHLGEGLYYGAPILPDEPPPFDAFKVARHAPGETIDPNSDGLETRPGDEESFRPALRRWLPDADGSLAAMRVCMYENSADQHCIIDHHPDAPNVVIACGFSGHGFKFASVVGEIAADLVIDGHTRHPIEFLRLSRFGDGGFAGAQRE